MYDVIATTFPEVREVEYKDGETVIDEGYSIVLGDNSSQLEVEAAKLLAKRIEELINKNFLL